MNFKINMNKLILYTIISCIAFSQNYDPETGEILQDSTQVKIQFDPETGIQLLTPSKKEVISPKKELIRRIDPGDNSLIIRFSNEEIINRAKIDAKRSFNSFPWAGLGGPSTLYGAAITGGIGGEMGGEGAAIGGFLGGAYFLPKLLSKMRVNIPYYYISAISENATQQQIKLYKEIYEAETIYLREKAIYKGQLGTAGACVGFILFMIFTAL